MTDITSCKFEIGQINLVILLTSKMKKALIIQGGGFRTAFSAGVLDAFLKNNYTDFSLYAGVSG